MDTFATEAISTAIRRSLLVLPIGGLVLVAAFARGVPAVSDALSSPSAPPSQQPHTANPSASSSPYQPTAAPVVAPGTPGTSATAAPTPIGYPAVPIESGGTLAVTPGAVADIAPGHYAKRNGNVRVDHVTLPAPWTGGSTNSVDIYIRVPAGYDPAHRRYPSVYITPNPYTAWSHELGPHSAVSASEAAGDIPPMIYVIAPAIAGPYLVTQCIDSSDGRQHWDTFMSSTLIAWVDSHYATLADPAARTIVGSSQGGYCAADLLLRHPDVWHQEISFAGFYDAPPRNPETAGGGAVFGGDQALMDACSPITIAPQLPAATRQTLFFALSGLSTQAFYGPQMDRFSGVLDQNGYARAVIQAPFGHSSRTVQEFLPRALRLTAARMVLEGTIS